jgi:hypothetical protein
MLKKYFLSALALIISLTVSGCTTLHHTELPSNELQKQLSAGKLITAGDYVKIITSDGQHLSFKVTKMTKEQLFGSKTSVPINKVIALETSEMDFVKTATSTGIVWLSMMAIGAAILL